MSEPGEIRKLAAVMFTDLEGYTAMFQKDEPSSMNKIRIHRQYLEKITGEHHGQIIQFYGDGSLVIFDSVMDAIRSAIEIQKTSKEWQIPVRAGIHIGDVVFKDKDVFGDVINVASRIQTIGVPGSIVVSRKVADEIKNQPSLGTTRLGEYSLKNVENRLELFAITGPGLVIPPVQATKQKKSKTTIYLWIVLVAFIAYAIFFNTGLFKSSKSKIQEGRIAVLPFQNYTLNPNLNDVGDEASSYISRDLKASSNADVVSFTSGLLYTDADIGSMSKNPSLLRQTGAANVLEGSYGLTGSNNETLVFWASFIDTRTNKTLPVTIPKVYCSVNRPMDGIRQMSNLVAGYWESKGEHLISFTNDDAYKAFIKAQKLWASPFAEIKKKAKELLIQAITYDSTFKDAYFLLMDGFHNDGDYDSEKDTINLFKSRFPLLQPREENNLTYYEEDLEGNNLEAYHHFIKEYPVDSSDLFINTTGMVMAVEYLNDPHTALRFNKDINMDSLNLKTCTYCRVRTSMAMQAYADASDNINAKKLAEKLKPYPEKPGHATRLIAFYMSIGDTASVNEIILQMSRDTSGEKDNYQFYSLQAGQYAMLDGNNVLRNYYADRAILRYGNAINVEKGRCYYLKGDLVAAEKIFNTLIKEKPTRNRYEYLGLVYARLGDTEKANDFISKLNSLKKDWDFGQTPYFQGRIKAVLGENEAAIQYLSTALDEGIKFQPGSTFQHDPDLMGLNQDPKYIALLSRNRQK